MTPRPLRRPTHSTTTTSTLIRGSTIPHTRSMARLASTINTNTSKFQVYDENSSPPSSAQSIIEIKKAGKGLTTKNLRSRGPLKESKSINNFHSISISNMNILEETYKNDKSIGNGKGDDNSGLGKRKVVEDDGRSKKIKMDHQRSSNELGIGGRVKKEKMNQIRTIGHQSSSELMRSLKPSVPSTPIPTSTNLTPSHSIAAIAPTPARELLKKDDNSTSPSTSPPTRFIARPPTPPRMKEKPVAMTSTNIPPITPKRARSPSEGINKPLSKMPASLRKTPGPPSIPSSLSIRPVQSTPSHTVSAEDPKLTALPNDTSSLAPSPRKVFSVPRTVHNGSTTPSGPPPTASRMPSSLATPNMRVVPPSPLTSRMAAASQTKRRSQPTLDSFLLKKESQRDVEDPQSQRSAPLGQQVDIGAAERLSSDSQTASQNVIPRNPSADLVEAGSGISSTPSNQMADLQLEETEPGLPASMIAETTPYDNPSSSLPSSKISSSRVTGTMGPPSRIPVSRQPSTSSLVTSAKPSTLSSTKKPATGLGSLPSRRPSTRPSLVPAHSTSSSTTSTTSPVKRKPSYPSSLGSGPLARPTPRMVSNPIVTPRASTNPAPTISDNEIPGMSTQRSVSAPVARSRLSLSSREGLTGETSKSLAGLSDALNKLKMKKLEQQNNTPSATDSKELITPSIILTEPLIKPLNERPNNLTCSTSATASSSSGSRIGTSGHRPRSSIHPGDLSTSSDEGNHVADQSIAALLCSTNGDKCLKGVRAFVDVRTSDGEDSSRVFIDILKGLGAKVFVRPTDSCTHIIYKSGKPSTLSWWRKQDDPKPFMVGIKWVMECKKSGKRLEEAPFIVDTNEEDIFQKRRKSMEPKSLAASQGLGLGQPSTARQALLDVAQARRKSLMYAPKVSSPLKKAYMGLAEE
ncbi:uncharacterized protein IL334_000539 [Kwoniella shivajii]|uniref:BRCT domain-containing protein n=1 Tax=Kwoniella shivajii TaxID=564305 RepID=A0ABZ1CPP2_9TREE|nr:hypothetical protein IL334_000539 [Kwoniella shivajii]